MRDLPLSILRRMLWLDQGQFRGWACNNVHKFSQQSEEPPQELQSAWSPSKCLMTHYRTSARGSREGGDFTSAISALIRTLSNNGRAGDVSQLMRVRYLLVSE